MQRLAAIALSALVITLVSFLGKRFPSLSGVISTMPLIIPLSIWAVYQSGGRDYQAAARLTSAMIPGMALLALFVLCARLLIARNLPIYGVIGLSYLGWFLGYLVLSALAIL